MTSFKSISTSIDQVALSIVELIREQAPVWQQLHAESAKYIGEDQDYRRCQTTGLWRIGDRSYDHVRELFDGHVFVDCMDGKLVSGIDLMAMERVEPSFALVTMFDRAWKSDKCLDAQYQLERLERLILFQDTPPNRKEYLSYLRS